MASQTRSRPASHYVGPAVFVAGIGGRSGACDVPLSRVHRDAWAIRRIRHAHSVWWDIAWGWDIDRGVLQRTAIRPGGGRGDSHTRRAARLDLDRLWIALRATGRDIGCLPTRSHPDLHSHRSAIRVSGDGIDTGPLAVGDGDAHLVTWFIARAIDGERHLVRGDRRRRREQRILWRRCFRVVCDEAPCDEIAPHPASASSESRASMATRRGIEGSPSISVFGVRSIDVGAAKRFHKRQCVYAQRRG